MVRNLIVSLLVLTLVLPLAVQAQVHSQAVAQPRQFIIGFFEGGPYPQHEAFRENYRLQLEGMALPDVELVFSANAFRSAGWNRDTCRIMAGELAAIREIDLVVALGPWVVHDLLTAGFDRPILAAHQSDPIGAGLLNKEGRPIAENLCVAYDPEKLERDITYLTHLISGQKIGFLHFPGGGEIDNTLDRVSALGKYLNIEIISAEDYDNKGTFAFFKAYQSLPDDLDAIYVSPLYGLDAAKTGPFFDMILRDRVPVFSYEGRFHCQRGASITFGSDNMIAESYFQVERTRLIIEGAIPAELSTAFHLEPHMCVNLTSAVVCRVEIPRDLTVFADLIGEPNPAEMTHFDLTTALDHALAANSDLLGLSMALDEAKASQKLAASEYRPQLSAVGELAWSDKNAVHNAFDEIKSHRTQAQFRLSQKIFDLESLGRKSIAGSLYELATASVDSMRLDLQRDVTIAYYDYLRAQEFEELVSEYRRRIDLSLESAYARAESHSSDATAKIRWEYERSRVTKLLLEARTGVRIALGQFNVLLSQPYSTKVELSPSPASVSQLITEYTLFAPIVRTDVLTRRSLNRLAQLALEHRPDLMARSARISRANQILKMQRKKFFPKIGFQASFGWVDKLADQSSELIEESTQMEAMVRFDWPLFAGGGRFAEIEKTRAGLDRLEYESDAGQFRAISQVRTYGERFIGALDAISAVSEARSHSESYLNLITQDYLSGSAELLITLDAQESWLAARLDEIEARYGYLKTSARLLRSVGGSLSGRGRTPGEALASYLSE